MLSFNAEKKNVPKASESSGGQQSQEKRAVLMRIDGLLVCGPDLKMFPKEPKRLSTGISKWGHAVQAPGVDGVESVQLGPTSPII